MENFAKRRSRWNQKYSIYFLKSRDFNGFQDRRHRSSNDAGASSYHVKSDSHRHEENKEGASCGQEIIRASFSLADALELACGICKELLRAKTCVLENTISPGEISVVAILVCGHVFHAECLEKNTCHEAIRDPCCPSCEGRENIVYS